MWCLTLACVRLAQANKYQVFDETGRLVALMAEDYSVSTTSSHERPRADDPVEECILCNGCTRLLDAGTSFGLSICT